MFNQSYNVRNSRIKAGICYVIKEINNSVGDTYLYYEEIKRFLVRVLGVNISEELFDDKGNMKELKGVERFIFAKLYAGGFSKKLYRLYEYQKK